MSFDVSDYLKHVFEDPLKDIEPGLCALALSSQYLPDLSVDRYFSHLQSLARDVGVRYQALIEEGSLNDCGVRLAALKYVLSERCRYVCALESDESLETANLMRVIELRKGRPEALAILYLHAALVQGWDVCVLRFPYAALCRIEVGGERLIFNPTDSSCKVLGAPDLRALVKKFRGDQAELSAAYYEPLSHRSLIVRLQNYLKLRFIEAGEYQAAFKVVELSQKIDPDEYRLLLDAGVLSARNHEPERAVAFLEAYIERSPHIYERQEATLLLRQIQGDMLS